MSLKSGCFCLSLFISASALSSPLISVTSHSNENQRDKIESTSLVIFNLLNDDVYFDIHGEEFSLPPASGLDYDCAGLTNIEIAPKSIEDSESVIDPFLVHCGEKITFGIDYMAGDKA